MFRESNQQCEIRNEKQLILFLAYHSSFCLLNLLLLHVVNDFKQIAQSQNHLFGCFRRFNPKKLMLSITESINVTKSTSVRHISSDERYLLDRMLLYYLLKKKKILPSKPFLIVFWFIMKKYKKPTIIKLKLLCC